MNRLLIFIFTISLYACGQATKFADTSAVAKIYSQAIGDFIQAANQKNATPFDTLYIAKRKMGQADDFPDIILPKKIENTQIILIAPELGEKLQKAHKTQVYINLVGWVNAENAEFVFVIFSNGFQHQYDYTIDYKYNSKLKEFELENVTRKDPPFNK